MNAYLKRTLPWSLVAYLASCSAACTLTHEAPQGGTETGNPPVIDASLISLVVSQDEVHVRGAPGAVTPGAQIEVTSTLTGAVFHGQAASDGSFDIRVDTPITDSFEVRARLGGQRSSTVQVVRGGASVGDGGDAGQASTDAGEDTQALSCMDRDQMARARMGATAETADTSCTRDEDCVIASTSTACSDGCWGVAVSSAGAQALQATRAEIEAGLCKEFTSDGCNVLALPCTPPVSSDVGCRDRRCQLLAPEPETCPTGIPLRGSACSGALTCDYGECVLDWYEQATCVDGKWASRTFSCSTGEWGPLRTADCSSDFDPGTGGAGMEVFWYYPQAGVCLHRTYGGMGGNDNRYETLEACEAACSRPSLECPPNRIEMDVCVEPAPIAGCLRTAHACALACSTHDQCTGQPIGPFCLDGGCQSYSPF